MRVTAKQIECANLVNLPDFLRNQGFELKRVGKEYVLKEHDSLHIKDNKPGERGKWFQFSADEGGNNIQFVQKFMDLDFISAVELLSNERAIPTKAHYYSESEAEPPEKREIEVHDSKDISRISSYLHGVRGLSAESLAKLIAEGRLSQEEKTGNAVFKIFDENGLLVGAEKVGTTAEKFKSVAKGSASGYGFEICKGNSINTYFFESAIDAVSFVDLYPELDNYRLISMMGVKPSMVASAMQRYAIQPENIFLCTDNDKAGNEFAEKLIAQYPAMRRMTPQGAKDWNDILQGRIEKMKLYGNTYWQEATDNRDKTVAVMHEDTFRQLQETLDKSGLNYCAYSDGKNAMVAVNSSEVDRFRTITGLDDTLCRLQKSSREHIPQDKNIIGNTEYRYISQKNYLNEDRETVLKMAELANKANIQFSARIYPNGKATMTVSQADFPKIREIQDTVREMRQPMMQQSRQATQKIIGNKPYREICNRHFFISPLTPEKYHKIEPKLFEKNAEFSGLIRDNKVMFTVEQEQAEQFHAILRQTICENQIRENLQKMKLDDSQIAVLNSSILLASRQNMPNIVENYVSSEYDTTQLNTMDNLLFSYLNQGENSQFLDNGKQLEMLLATKMEFDSLIAQRDKLVESEEIYTPETPENSVFFSFGDKEWFTESELLDDFAKANPEISFALANAILGYLDEKQHAERVIPELHAGWYKKTDFTVKTTIDGQEFTHSGRFDIGDGKGTGGGTLIDHIELFAQNALKDQILYGDDDSQESLHYLLDSVVPFLKENSELSLAEQVIFDDFKAQNSIRTIDDVEIEKSIMFKLYQMKDSEEYHGIRFETLEQNKLHDNQLNIDDYHLAYEGDLNEYSGNTVEEKLETLYEEFNINKPVDYIGHSMSVSDVVVVNDNAYYCDSVGFKEYPEFLREKEVEPPVIADFRTKTEENFSFYDYKPREIENMVKDFVSQVFVENGITAEIGGAAVFGSRSRGLEKADSDIDVVIEIDSDLGEDDLFNILHGENFEIESIPVDINPIKADKTGILETYLPNAEKYLAEKAHEKVQKKDEITQETPTEQAPQKLDLSPLQQQAVEIAKKYQGKPLQEKINTIAQTFGCTSGKIVTSPCGGKWRGTSDISIEFDNGKSLGISNRMTKEAKKVSVQNEIIDKKLVQYNPEIVELSKKTAFEILKKREAADNAVAEAKGLKPYTLLNVEFAEDGDGAGGYMGWYFATLAVDDKIFGYLETGLNYEVASGKASETHTREKYFVAGGLADSDADFVFNNVGHSSKIDMYTIPLSSEVLERAKKALAECKQEQTGKNLQFEQLFNEEILAENDLGFVADKPIIGLETTNPNDFVQLDLFGEPQNIPEVNRFEELHKEIMRGTGFEGGKFRIAEFFNDPHSVEEQNLRRKEFVDFVKNEYGTGGHSAESPIAFVSHDSNGIHFMVDGENGGISNENFDFSWKTVADCISGLIRKDQYITKEEIDRRNDRIQPKTERSKTKDADTLPTTKIPEKSQNFTITDDNFGEGGAKTKFRNNLLAIQTLKQVESEGRKATPEEQEILSKYVGWGGLPQAFDSDNEQWGKEWSQLFKALTPKEYDEARRSVLDSFFTSPAIIDGIYEALGKFGFKGGNLLEPSCGVGNFLGKMPSEMAEHTHIYGVEIDSVSGRIAKQLYPDADIQVTGFENTNFQDGSFDVAVGNVPFGDLNFADTQYGTTKLHDFFFAQTLDKVKDGGIVAFVTSKGTLDKKDESFRRQLAEKADLIGAVRLPNNAFKANAGTEVTSDIILLQKRSAPPEELPDWVHLGETADGLRVNSYFAENPEMVLGKIVEGNKLYGRNDDTMCVPIEGANLRQQIHDAVQKLDAQISAVKTNEVFQFSDKQVTMTASELRPFSFFKDDKGDIYLKGGESKLGKFDVSKVMDSKSKNYDRMTAFIDLRDTVRELLKVQAEDKLENEIKAVQQKLSTQYDDFYKKYGLLHSRKNRSVLRDDCSYNLLLTLEKEFDKDKLIAKSDIFTKRTVRPSKPIEHVDTALEALTISMAETAKVDLAYMSKLTDMSEEMLISELKGEIFLVPNAEEYQSASEYLSGDIRKKIDIAESVAEKDSRFAGNVEALKSAMPEPLKAGDIDVKIGATWIPKELYQQFMYELFQTPMENREDVKKAFWVKPKNITVDYSEHTNTWHIENKKADCSVICTRDYGSRKMGAYEIMEHLLNLKEPKVYKPETYIDQNGDEKERRVVDVKATKIVQQKAAKIKQAFKDWIFKDPERAVKLVEQYNRQFNSIRPREYDGSALRFPGMNSAITLKEHQKNAIAHALFGGNTLFAHCVGAGKSATRS